jgi:hypothetical protein
MVKIGLLKNLPILYVLSSSLSWLSFVSVIILLTIVVVTLSLFPVVLVWVAAASALHHDSNGLQDHDNHTPNHATTNFAKNLGWMSIGAGVLANVPLIFYVRVKRISVATLGGGHEITRNLAAQHNAVINLHMIINIIGFIAGITHGILLVKGLDAISFSLALTMTVLVASGILLRFSTKSTKYFSRLFHGQILLSGLLILLIILHVASMRGLG